MRKALPLDGFYVCYHDDADACECRKPKPGLLLTAAKEHGISLPASYMVGDRWRDVEAGQRGAGKTAESKTVRWCPAPAGKGVVERPMST